jgi:transcription elongation factor Elf1
MTQPEEVNLTCAYCGRAWIEPVSNLSAQKDVIYKNTETVKTVSRRVKCANCGQWVNVSVPREWLADE